MNKRMQYTKNILTHLLQGGKSGKDGEIDE
jgi:hypothetical protein